MERLLRFLKDEEGSNAAEYALLVALIAIVLIAGATLLGNAVNNKLTEAGNSISGAPAPGQ